MQPAWLDTLLQWIGEHPLGAGAVVFAIAFCDALVVLGLVVPALPLLFGVGTLVGLGLVDPWYAVASATLGALCGDTLSYLVGRHYGDRLKRIWPFVRHPQWLDSGERLFRRHGLKGILIARYVGAVRPFVPAIAGMLRMRLRSYLPASVFACVSWAVLFIAPGWLFGASLELLIAIAGRLALIVGLLLASLAAVYLISTFVYRLLAPRAGRLAERLLAWSHRHPVLGRYSEALVDPRRPESVSLLVFAVVLIAAGWGFFALLGWQVGRGEPLPLDLAVHQALFALRHPLADRLMAMLAALGDWQVWGPAALLVFGWLLWRRRRIAALHWLAAPAFGAVLVGVLGAVLQMPAPGVATAVEGFRFPSTQTTMATVVYGFFAVLVARELPFRRQRAWPYAAAALLVALVGFARLYFGAHWFSDVLGGMLLGAAWVGLLGLAYRRRVTRSFWLRPLSLLFFTTLAVAGVWHGLRDLDARLLRYALPQPRIELTREQWWSEGWALLPGRRNEFTDERAWPLNVQYAGSLPSLRRRLRRAGWETVPPAGWNQLLMGLDADIAAETLPLLPAAHHGHAEAISLWLPAQPDGTRLVLRLWQSPLRLQPGEVPVWQGTLLRFRFERHAGLLSLWRRTMDAPDEFEALVDAVPDLAQRRVRRADGAITVLLSPPPAAARMPPPGE